MSTRGIINDMSHYPAMEPFIKEASLSNVPIWMFSQLLTDVILEPSEWSKGEVINDFIEVVMCHDSYDVTDKFFSLLPDAINTWYEINKDMYDPYVQEVMFNADPDFRVNGYVEEIAATNSLIVEFHSNNDP